MKRLTWLLTPVAAALLTLAVACGDSGGAGGGTAGGGGTVSTELDLTNVTTQLMQLRSFRFDAALKMEFDMSSLSSGSDEDAFGAAFAGAFLALFGDIKLNGVYVAPDSFDMTITMLGGQLRFIQIGNQAWMNVGMGWQPAPVDGGLGFLGNPSEMAFDLIPAEVLRNATTKAEKVNGMDTIRYSFDKASLEALARQLGEDDLDEVEEARLDIWIAQGNIPVKLSMDLKGTSKDGSGMSMSLDFSLTEINNSSLKVEKPS